MAFLGWLGKEKHRIRWVDSLGVYGLDWVNNVWVAIRAGDSKRLMALGVVWGDRRSSWFTGGGWWQKNGKGRHWANGIVAATRMVCYGSKWGVPVVEGVLGLVEMGGVASFKGLWLSMPDRGERERGYEFKVVVPKPFHWWQSPTHVTPSVVNVFQ